MAVEHAQLLGSMGGIIGRIHIQQNFATAAHRFPTDANEPFQSLPRQARDVPPRQRVLQPRQGGLRSQFLAQRFVGHHFQDGIVTQLLRVIGILITGANSIEALAQHLQQRVVDALGIAGVLQGLRQIGGQVMALVKGAQGQQTSVTADLPAIKIGPYLAMRVESEGRL